MLINENFKSEEDACLVCLTTTGNSTASVYLNINESSRNLLVFFPDLFKSGDIGIKIVVNCYIGQSLYVKP